MAKRKEEDEVWKYSLQQISSVSTANLSSVNQQNILLCKKKKKKTGLYQDQFRSNGEEPNCKLAKYCIVIVVSTQSMEDLEYVVEVNRVVWCLNQMTKSELQLIDIPQLSRNKNQKFIAAFKDIPLS